MASDPRKSVSHPSTDSISLQTPNSISLPPWLRKLLGDRYDLNLSYRAATMQHELVLIDKHVGSVQMRVVADEVVARGTEVLEATVIDMLKVAGATQNAQAASRMQGQEQPNPAHYPTDDSYPHLDDELDVAAELKGNTPW